MGVKDKENNIYKLAKTREMKTLDLNVVQSIKDEDQKVLINEEQIKERLRKLFW